MDFPGLHQVRKNLQVRLVQIREEDPKFLTDKPRADDGVERATQPSQGFIMPARAAEADHDADAVRSKNLATLGEGMVVYDIVDQIVTLISLGKIFLCVIDHVIGADRTDEINVSSARDGGDFSAE